MAQLKQFPDNWYQSDAAKEDVDFHREQYAKASKPLGNSKPSMLQSNHRSLLTLCPQQVGRAWPNTTLAL